MPDIIQAELVHKPSSVWPAYLVFMLCGFMVGFLAGYLFLFFMLRYEEYGAFF